MNSAILKNIFRRLAPSFAGLTAAGGGLYGTAKWYDASNEKNLQSPNSPNSQPRSRIMQAIVDANPNSMKQDVLTNSKWPLGNMFTYVDPKSNIHEDPVPQEDFAYGRSRAANIQSEQQAASEEAEREQAVREQVAKLFKNTPFSKDTPEQLKDPSKLESFRALDKNLGAATRSLNTSIPPYVLPMDINSVLNSNIPDGGRQLNIGPEDSKRLDALAGVGNTNSVTTSKSTPASPNVIPNNPTNTNVPHTSQQPGTAAPTPNASADDKTSNNQNVFNSIAASLNNNPGYLMPTAIGQTLIAALLGRLLGGKTGMGLGAIMGLLASPLTASWLAKNNYLSNIAKPFSETEKGWFSNSK